MLTANKQKGENTNICEVERLSLVSHEEKQINTNWTLKKAEHMVSPVGLNDFNHQTSS